jgi:putative restriction endonuclease
MRLYVGVTDSDWFEFLSSRPNVDEVNFWQPSPQNLPRLALGDMFLFKLKSPHNAIAGGGYFLRALQMPVSYAWEAYAEKNGAASLQDLRTRLVRLRSSAKIERGDFRIGCLLLTQPFFLSRDKWIPQPRTWASNIVRGQYYDSESPEGKYLFDAVSRTQTDRMLEQVIAADAPQSGPVTRGAFGRCSVQVRDSSVRRLRRPMTGAAPSLVNESSPPSRPRTFSRSPREAPTNRATGCYSGLIFTTSLTSTT